MRKHLIAVVKATKVFNLSVVEDPCVQFDPCYISHKLLLVPVFEMHYRNVMLATFKATLAE